MIAQSSRGRDSPSLWQRGGGRRCPQQAWLRPVTFTVMVPVAQPGLGRSSRLGQDGMLHWAPEQHE